MTQLVLLPGMDGTGVLFAPFKDALNDLPSKVIPYPPDRAMNYAALESHARAQLPRDEDYVLVSESFSGPVGIALAASRPPGLRALVLCATFAANPFPAFGPLRRFIDFLPVTGLPPMLAKPWLYAGRGTRELHRLYVEAVSPVGAKAWRARLAAVLGADARAQLARIDVPMLYLRARRDRLMPTSASRSILGVRPDIEVAEVDAPHFVLQSEPVKCALAIRAFMHRHGIEAPAQTTQGKLE